MQLRALSNINSGQYVAGDVFASDDIEAEQLIEAGAAELVSEAAEESTESVSETDTATEAASEQTAEATATPAPLEEASDSSSSEAQAQKVEVKTAEPALDPLEAQIQKDVAETETGSTDSSEVKIS